MRRWLGLLAAALVLAGCTGIPDSSAPQVVRTVPRAPTPTLSQAQIAPRPGDGPQDLVREFQLAELDADAGHSTARQFLTKDASRRWQDNSTVILDVANPGDVRLSDNDLTASVPVRGRRKGALDASGLFTPTLKGIGLGDEETFTYILTRPRVTAEWRIDQLPQGVVIDATAFKAYQSRRLYFFDPTGKIVVPDLRYSPPLKGRQAQASWLLAQLVAGPRLELAQSVLNEVPDQDGKSSVQLGNPTLVEMPGTSQLEPDGRNNLAAQLAFTLSQVGLTNLELTDSGKPVRIPSASSLQFSTSDFSSDNPEQNVVPDHNGVYYLRDGAVVDGKTGSPLPNSLGQPGWKLSSVALRRNPSQLLAAGVTTTGQLLLGDERRLAQVSVPHPTSRPEWRPLSEDVWLGAGNPGGVYRVVSADEPARQVSITSQVGAVPNGPITALRFSPDGTRIALVIQSAEGGGAWIGSVVTSGQDVRIDALEPLTPPNLTITDLAWADSVKLDLVSALPGAEAQVRTVNSDGSQLDTYSNIGNVGLTGSPTAITATLEKLPVVSAGDSIWAFDSTDGNDRWVKISGSQGGYLNPIYAS